MKKHVVPLRLWEALATKKGGAEAPPSKNADQLRV